MADIRINALATTAASTASDDFIAVDGSANGTRKLNAYSPTFGGNLTVSGTGTVTGDVTITRANSGGGVGVRNVNTDSSGYASLSLNNSGGTAQSFDIGTGGSAVAITALRQKLYIYDNTAGTTVMRLSGGSTSAVEFLGTGTHSFAGNLTVSGTGTSSVAGNLQIGGTPNIFPSTVDRYSAVNVTNVADFPAFSLSVADGTKNFRGSMYIDTSTTQEQFAWDFVYSSSNFPQYRWKIAGTTLATLRENGNFILSSTGTDNANGKLQLADHTTSAGGIGFGADTSLYRAAQSIVAIDGLSTAYAKLRLYESSVLKVQLESAGGDFTLATLTAGKSLKFNSGNDTLALTLDSSQNAIFAGSTGVQLKNDSFLYFGSTVRTAVKGNSTGSLELYANNNLSLTLDSSANATFAGRAYINGATASSALDARISTGTTNDTVAASSLSAISTGTATDGFGGRLNFLAKDLTGNESGMASIRWAVKNTGYSNREGELSLWTFSNGVAYRQLTLSPGTGAAGTSTFVGPIAIGNTVNTVSPTSPNRTITMVIGGTTYYIHAKTTND